MWRGLVVVFFMLVANPAAQAQSIQGWDVQGTPASAQPAAQAALVTFKQAVAMTDPRLFGFFDANDLRSATLDSAFVSFMVRLDELREYTPQRSALELVRPSGLVHFLLRTPRGGSSSLEMHWNGEAWKPASIGGANRSRLIRQAIASLRSTAQVPHTQMFLLRIPSFNLEFVAHLSGNAVRVVPIADYPEAALRRGTYLDAQSLFLALVPAARVHDELPR